MTYGQRGMHDKSQWIGSASQVAVMDRSDRGQIGVS